MWYIVIGFIAIIYLLINLFLPGITSSTIVSYVIQPALWLALAIMTIVLARHDGMNIFYFKKERKWNLGKTPVHAGLLFGGFQVSLLIIAGLVVGFGRSPYSYSPTAITLTALYVGTFLLGTEISRAYLIKTGSYTKNYLTLTLVLTTLVYVILQFSINDFSVLDFASQTKALEFLGGKLLVAISIGLLASYLAYLGGATASISYMAVILTFEWFSPILPSIDWTILALIGTIAPAIGFITIQSSLLPTKNKRKIFRKKHKERNSIRWITTAIICLIITFFSFGYLGITPTVIYSGSMQPTLDVGDVALIVDVDPAELKEGEIIVYISYDNVTSTIHRIIEIYKEGAQTYYLTKGDANTDADFKAITADRITGKMIFVIPKIGWITIILKNILKI